MKVLKVTERPPMTQEDVDNLKKKREDLDKELLRKNRETSPGHLTGRQQQIRLAQDRFYLPVLHLNDPQQWPSEPMENRVHWTDKMAEDTCLGNCCGVPGLRAGCCYMDLDDLEHVLGPVEESWIKDTVRWLRKQGVMATRTDLVIDFEEGKVIGEKWFSGEKRRVFQEPETYPILRFQVVGPRFACKFLNPVTGKCTIYEKRPGMCRGYLCQYVKGKFLVRTQEHPNTYTKVR